MAAELSQNRLRPEQVTLLWTSSHAPSDEGGNGGAGQGEKASGAPATTPEERRSELEEEMLREEALRRLEMQRGQ